MKKEEVWREKILPHIAEVYLWHLRIRGCLFYPPLTTKPFEGNEYFMANNILLSDLMSSLLKVNCPVNF